MNGPCCFGRRHFEEELLFVQSQVVFSDPYMESEMNRWTSPELDDAAASLRSDVALKLNASRLKQKFMSSCEVQRHLLIGLV